MCRSERCRVAGTLKSVGTRFSACPLVKRCVIWCCVGMYLRETRRKNKDGSVVSYLQLAHNERHPDTGSSTAKVIHNFGRAEAVDREALARLVASISRFLAPDQAAAAAAGGEVEMRDA